MKAILRWIYCRLLKRFAPRDLIGPIQAPDCVVRMVDGSVGLRCRCGEIHHGEYFQESWFHHNCFHHAELVWLGMDSDGSFDLMCMDCGETFNAESIKNLEPSDFRELTEMVDKCRAENIPGGAPSA